MTSHAKNVSDWIDKRIETILATPEMWGSAEAVEMQILQLLETRFAATHPVQSSSEPRTIFRAYAKHLVLIAPSVRGPASEIFRDKLDQLIDVLRSFVVASRANWPAENPFSAYELVIDVTYKQGCDPSAASVNRYVEDVRKVVRAASREVPGQTGRGRKDIEAATDFVYDELRIVQKNGVPARVMACLGPSAAPTQGDLLETRNAVRDGFGRVLELAEWAGQGSAPPATSDIEQRGLLALQTRRLLPSGDVERVEIGGKLASRSAPVVFLPSFERKLVTLLEDASQDEIPFSKADQVRLIDLDRGVIRIGKKDRIDCYLRPEDMSQITEIGRQVEVYGRLIQPLGGKKFVVADRVIVPD